MFLRIPGGPAGAPPFPGAPATPPTADGWAAVTWCKPFYSVCKATAEPGPSAWKVGPCDRQDADTASLSAILCCVGCLPPEPNLGRAAFSPFADGFYITDSQ